MWAFLPTDDCEVTRAPGPARNEHADQLGAKSNKRRTYRAGAGARAIQDAVIPTSRPAIIDSN